MKSYQDCLILRLCLARLRTSTKKKNFAILKTSLELKYRTLSKVSPCISFDPPPKGNTATLFKTSNHLKTNSLISQNPGTTCCLRFSFFPSSQKSKVRFSRNARRIFETRAPKKHRTGGRKMLNKQWVNTRATMNHAVCKCIRLPLFCGQKKQRVHISFVETIGGE